MPISLEDHAAMRLAGESVECLCDEYASLVLSQVEEIKRLKDLLLELTYEPKITLEDAK